MPDKPQKPYACSVCRRGFNIPLEFCIHKQYCVGKMLTCDAAPKKEGNSRDKKDSQADTSEH